MPDSLKIRLLKLSLVKKAVLLGSFFTVISVFMTWYSDVDQFSIGESFIGLSGPLYLAGFFVFISGAVVMAMIAMELMERNLPKLPLKESQMYIAASALSFFLLIITASAYFHPKFGVNLTGKNLGFGMILSYIGSGLVMLGGLLSSKSKPVSFEEAAGEIRPLIDMDLQHRERGDSGIKKTMTVGDAMDKYTGESKHGWGMAEESIEKVREEKWSE